MKQNKSLLLAIGTVVALASSVGTANADVSLGLRAGTPGIGLELGIGLTETLNLRLGYAAYDYSTEIEDTDVTYDGDLELRNPSALLDWHAFGGGFRFSFGAVGASTKAVGTGVPNAGNVFVIDNTPFAASEIGQLDAEVEASNSVAPYIGIGWGNSVDAAGRWTFLFDVGAIYYGSEPDVAVNVTCGPALANNAARCNLLRAEVENERQDLMEEVDTLNWYPVLNFGVAFRF